MCPGQESCVPGDSAKLSDYPRLDVRPLILTERTILTMGYACLLPPPHSHYYVPQGPTRQTGLGNTMRRREKKKKKVGGELEGFQSHQRTLLNHIYLSCMIEDRAPVICVFMLASNLSFEQYCLIIPRLVSTCFYLLKIIIIIVIIW